MALSDTLEWKLVIPVLLISLRSGGEELVKDYSENLALDLI